MSKFIPYYRVSTDKQGINGLGMDAQREIVSRFLGSTKPHAEFVEVESGRNKDRPELNKALEMCKKVGGTLLIAKLDRLSRNASFTLSLRDSGVEFIACDMPQANRLTIGILAVVAEHEAEMISQRTKDGLDAAKRRGVKMGNPRWQGGMAKAQRERWVQMKEFRERMKPVVEEIRAAGVTTLVGIAQALNARGFKGLLGAAWRTETVRTLVK